jgi:membrane protease YdiL (CAAX protease family)
LVLTGLHEGHPGLKQMWQRTIQVKIGWRWYLAALALVILGSTGQITLNYLFGHSFDFSLFLTQLPSFLPLILIGPLSEELGWRGYAQTRLQKRWNPLISGLVVGMVWAFWHLPLFLVIGTSQHELHIPFAGFFCGVTAVSVLMAYLHNHTHGSIWTAIFFHWIYTSAGQVIATGVTRGPLFNWLEYTPYVLLALVIAIVWSRELKTQL